MPNSTTTTMMMDVDGGAAGGPGPSLHRIIAAVVHVTEKGAHFLRDAATLAPRAFVKRIADVSDFLIAMCAVRAPTPGDASSQTLWVDHWAKIFKALVHRLGLAPYITVVVAGEGASADSGLDAHAVQDMASMLNLPRTATRELYAILQRHGACVKGAHNRDIDDLRTGRLKGLRARVWRPSTSAQCEALGETARWIRLTDHLIDLSQSEAVAKYLDLSLFGPDTAILIVEADGASITRTHGRCIEHMSAQFMAHRGRADSPEVLQILFLSEQHENHNQLIQAFCVVYEDFDARTATMTFCCSGADCQLCKQGTTRVSTASKTHVEHVLHVEVVLLADNSALSKLSGMKGHHCPFCGAENASLGRTKKPALKMSDYEK